MAHACGLLSGLGRTPVFVIDREADSVGHYRRWGRAGRRFVVRADAQRKVLHEGHERELSQVLALRRRRGGLSFAREVEFKGKPARQYVGETRVVLHRPARTHRVEPATGKPRHRNVAGRPLPLRLVVSEVRDAGTGAVLAAWLLLTNLPPSLDAATVALWYYWRWRIESYHKLLKGAGQQVESWQQESAEALAKRLTVASMAAAVVWRLARDDRPEAARVRGLLVRLSGRQIKRTTLASRGFTEPALMAGLNVLLPMLELLRDADARDLRDLRRLVEAVLPGLLHRETG
jgi:hypothetical protein